MSSMDAILAVCSVSPFPSVPVGGLNDCRAIVHIRATVKHLRRNARNVGSGCEINPLLAYLPNHGLKSSSLSVSWCF